MNARADRYPAFRERGVTLIELLMVVVIVSILATIAISSYRSQVTKATRAAAKSCINQYAQFMERYYTTQLTYTGAAPVLDCATDGTLSARYAIAVPSASLSATAYSVTATPTAAWSTRDSRCGTLTLNQAGTRGAGTNTPADIQYCW